MSGSGVSTLGPSTNPPGSYAIKSMPWKDSIPTRLIPTNSDTFAFWMPIYKHPARFLNQQFHTTGINDSPTVTMSLADRDFLQMDHAAPSYQSILWDYRECRQEPNLDCNYNSRAGSHSQKADTLRPQPLHNSTDFESDTLRQNAYFRSSLNCSNMESQDAPCNQLCLLD
jgi:hypothetical protein